MSSRTSRAAIFTGKPHELQQRTVAVPDPAPGEVLVRVLAATICGSDRHSYEGRRKVPVPTILGHEIVGRIEAVGSGFPGVDFAGKPLKVGDRITWAIVASCGKCFYCKHGLPQKCEKAVKYGHEIAHPGQELTGGFADYCMLASGSAIIRLADELPLEVACPANCATATVAGSLALAGSLHGATVGVMGAGLLGLTACAMAHAAGAAKVIACDVDPGRRDQALRFGADHAAAPETFAADVAERVGHGLDVVVELSGQNAAFETALPTLRIGGQAILVGSVSPADPVPVRLEHLVRRCLTLHGLHNYAPKDLAAAVQFLEQNHRRFPFASLVGQWYPLEACEAAFKEAANPRFARIGVRPAD
jgi:alcohol dehydrogenase